MFRHATLFVIAFTSACTDAPALPERAPSSTTVARIERKLAKDPCAGALARFSRSYAYPWRGGTVDDRTIFVTLRASGAQPDVIIRTPDHGQRGADNAVGWGIYDVRNDRLTLAECAKAA